MRAKILVATFPQVDNLLRSKLRGSGLEDYPIPRKDQRKHPVHVKAAARRSVAGLPVTRTRIGPTIRYDLQP